MMSTPYTTYLQKPRKAFKKLRQLQDKGFLRPKRVKAEVDAATINWTRHTYRPFDEYEIYAKVKGVLHCTALLGVLTAVIYGVLH